MGKELIRNGSFERGDLKYWEMTTGEAFAIHTADKKYGTYSAQVKANGAGMFTVEHKDFIEIERGVAFRGSLWVKSTHTDLAALALNLYNEQLDYITPITIKSFYFSNTWTQYANWILIDEEAAYAKLKVSIGGAALNDEYLIDSLSLQRVSLADVVADYMPLIQVSNDNVEHTVYSDVYDTFLWREAVYVLECTSLTGGTPFLTVSIQGFDEDTSTWVDIIVFQHLGAGGGTERKVLSSGLGRTQRVKYVTSDAGVLTDCDFKVTGFFRR